jgi:GTPase
MVMTKKNNQEAQRSALIALVGEPNAGKSTLMNYLLNKKLAITSRKPQTTRHRLLGILTEAHAQYVFVDTPGLHPSKTKAFNRYLNRTATSALKGVDIVLFLVEGMRWTPYNDVIAGLVKQSGAVSVLVINKLDLIEDRSALLPFMDELQKKYAFDAMIPLSARTGKQVSALRSWLYDHLPLSPFHYPEDQQTDRDDAFLVTEMIREKLTRRLSQELPYALTVTLDEMKVEKKIRRISATIWVDKESQKPIIIGKQGAALKGIGSSARQAIEAYFDQKVFLQLWVKVKSNWAAHKASLRSLGYSDD